MLKFIQKLRINSSNSFYKCSKCGDVILVSDWDVKNKNIISCGCDYKPSTYTLMNFNEYIVNNTSDLKLLKIAGVTNCKGRHAIWKIQCPCGIMFCCRQTNLKAKKYLDCGCRTSIK